MYCDLLDNIYGLMQVWKYHDLDRDGDGALTVVQTNIETPVGLYRTDGLLTGGIGGSLRYVYFATVI